MTTQRRRLRAAHATRPLHLGFTDNRRRPTDDPTGELRGVWLTEEERAAGMHIIGAPGSGKSKFLEHCIRDDIRNRRGLCLIDPHGDLYDAVLSWCAYVRPHRRIIPVNLTSPYIVGLNPLAGAVRDVHTRVNRCIEATVKAFGLKNTDETPTLERLLRCVYHALAENGLTIAEARHLLAFHETGIRDYLTSRISDEMIRQEWRELASLKTSREWREEIRSTKNKLLRFLTARSVLRFLAMTDTDLTRTLNPRQLMDEGAVVLVNLRQVDGALDQIDARLYGSFLVSQFFAAARSRGGLGQPRPRPFYLYCDEFQNFVSPDVAEILPQGRKFGLSLVLAHQFLAQLDQEDAQLVEAVMASARTKVVFGGLSYKDAVAMVPSLFAGQMDFHEVKRIDYSVKFWPVYGREKTYTKGRAHGEARGSSHTDAHGHTTGRGHTSGYGHVDGITTGSSFNTGDGYSSPDWPIDGLPHGSHFTSSGSTSMDASTSADSYMEADSEMETDSDSTADTTSESTSDAASRSVADIPIYHPVPFLEATVTPWSLEEIKERLTHTLMLQLQRHGFVKPRDGWTEPMLVPMVAPCRLPVRRVLDYQATEAKNAGAVTPELSDYATAARTKQIEHQARQFAASTEENVHSSSDHEPQQSTNPTRRIRPNPTLKPASRKAEAAEG